MKHNDSAVFSKTLISISTIITALSIVQTSYAQIQDSVFNSSIPLIEDVTSLPQFQESGFNSSDPVSENNPSSVEQSSVEFWPRPIVIANNQNDTHFVWESVENGKSEIIYAKRSSLGGFGNKINLSDSSGADSINPSMLVDNQNIYFAWWEKLDNGTYIPMFRATSDSGTTFGASAALSKLPFG
jgi:hypothetical protein